MNFRVITEDFFAVRAPLFRAKQPPYLPKMFCFRKKDLTTGKKKKTRLFLSTLFFGAK